MAVEIVNGKAGAPHVSGSDVGRLYAGVAGEGNYYLMDAPKASMASANRLSLGPCDLLCQGIHMTLDGLDEWTVETGSQGMKRRDLCCLRYSRDESTGVETAAPVTLKGTPAASDPKDPEVPSGSRLSDAAEATIPVARVTLDGLTPGTPELLLEGLVPLSTLRDSVSRTPKVFTGTMRKTATVGNDSVLMWTNAEFEARFGRKFNSNQGDLVAVMNGDGAAYGTHIQGAVYHPSYPSGGGVWAHLAKLDDTGASLRLNWLVVLGS